MAKIKNINLAFNCPQKLENKLYCVKCSHAIIDFTGKTEKEVREEVSNSNGLVCGIFKRSQLSEQFLKYAAATVIATALSAPSFGQEVNKGDTLIKASEDAEEVIEEEAHEFIGIILDVQAIPIGGFEKFLQTITDRIIYPVGLKESGKVFVEFTIDTTGQMTDIKLLKGYNLLADQEAVRVLSTLNHPFHPGRQRGKAVKTKIVIPLLFDPQKVE